MKVFVTMPHAFWFKLIPTEDEDLDVCKATGLKWDDLLALLLRSDVLSVKTKAKYGCNRKQMEFLKGKFGVGN